MLGDVNYRLPSIVDAITYTNAGVKTYLYYQGIKTFGSKIPPDYPFEIKGSKNSYSFEKLTLSLEIKILVKTL